MSGTMQPDWREVARTMAADQAREDYMDWLAECEAEDVLAEEHRHAYRARLRMGEIPEVHYDDRPGYDRRLFGP